MQPLDEDDGDDGDIVFRDLIMLTLSGFVTVAVLLLPHIGEPQAQGRRRETAQPPGNVMIEARWPDERRRRRRPVGPGAGRHAGRLFQQGRRDLQPAARRSRHPRRRHRPELRDRLRPRPAAGEYTVNLHLYRNSPASTVPVTVVASVKTGGPAGLQADPGLVRSSCTREGQELTVFRFRLDAPGALVPGSVTNLQKPLRDVAAVMSDLTPLFAVAVPAGGGLGHRSRLVAAPAAGQGGCAGARLRPDAGMAYGAMLDLLSKPKPASFEWWLAKAGEATVLGSSIRRGPAIYVWLQLDGVDEPRAYGCPGTAQPPSSCRQRARGGRGAADRAAHAAAVRAVARQP